MPQSAKGSRRYARLRDPLILLLRSELGLASLPPSGTSGGVHLGSSTGWGWVAANPGWAWQASFKLQVQPESVLHLVLLHGPSFLGHDLLMVQVRAPP